MKDKQLFEALEGLYAYDTGCTDSGIKDERLRAEVKRELQKDDAMKRLTQFARNMMQPPYTLEDCKAFIDWLSEHMDYDV